MRGILFLLGTFMLVNLIGQTVILKVPKLEQERSLWCWAASAEMIDSFHRSTDTTIRHRSQCEIVNQYFSLIYDFERELIFRKQEANGFNFGFPRTIPCNTYDCNDESYFGIPSSGNIEMYYQNSPAYFTGITYHNLLYAMKYYSNLDKNMAFDEVKNDILNCMPLILGLITKSGGYHIVVAKGYEITDTGNILYVNDPNKCQTCNVEMLNFEAISNDSCFESIHYFLAGIRSKDQEMCAPCGHVADPFAVYEPAVAVARSLKKSFYDSLMNDRAQKKNSAISIPISQINIDAMRSGKVIKLEHKAPLLVQKSTEDYYYSEGRYNVFAKQTIEGKEQIVQVKTCVYPKQDTIYPNGINREPLYFDWIKDAPNIEIIRLSGPLYYELYRYTRNGKSYIVSANNSQPIKLRNKILDKKEIISEKQLFCLFKSDFKTRIQGAKLPLPLLKSSK